MLGLRRRRRKLTDEGGKGLWIDATVKESDEKRECVAVEPSIEYI